MLVAQILSNEQNQSKNLSDSDLILVRSTKVNRIKFAIFLAFQLIILPCFFYAFVQYIRRSKLRQSLSYQLIFLLLFISFLFVTIVLSLTQAFLFTSMVSPASERFCSTWNWLHYSINIIHLFLMALTSIERYVLIFKAQLLRTKRAKYLLHYLPISFCLIYPPIFYFGGIVLSTCENRYEYDQLLCTWPGYFRNKIWANIDLFVNNLMPLFVIPSFCSAIYIRVFYQKYSMQLQVLKWRRDRKLILQLVAISSLYLIMWMPTQITGLINIYWDPLFLLQAQIDYMYLFPYFIHLLYPFIVLFIIHRKRGNFPGTTIAIVANNIPRT